MDWGNAIGMFVTSSFFLWLSVAVIDFPIEMKRNLPSWILNKWLLRLIALVSLALGLIKLFRFD